LDDDVVLMKNIELSQRFEPRFAGDAPSTGSILSSSRYRDDVREYNRKSLRRAFVAVLIILTIAVTWFSGAISMRPM